MITSYELDKFAIGALDEDLASGDLTTEAIVSPDVRAVGTASAKQRLVVCGGAIFARVFYQVEPGLRVEALLEDGSLAQPGDAIWQVEGPARALLMAERTALNFVQRLSGIATLSRRYVEALPNPSRVRITDTRKTTPGLRRLSRYAVRCGGAYNHRNNLGASILIKENHIAAASGIEQAVASARRWGPHGARIEVEVKNLAELEAALAARADIVLLDNFDTEDIRVAVERAQGKVVLEVSGNVTLERIPTLAELGVDVISVGALTHSAPAADISFNLTWVS